MDKSKIKVGRPPMLSGKRIHIIKAKLTDGELTALLKIQKKSGLNRMELIRRQLFKNETSVVLNISELLNALDTIGNELGRAGNNINQLARHANTINKQGRLTPQTIVDFNNLFSGYIHTQQQLEKLLRHILRAMKPR